MRQRETSLSPQFPRKDNEMKKTHIMLDLETLGTKLGCPILSIGAHSFTLPDLTSTERDFAFYARIGADYYKENLKAKRWFQSDESTIAWWEQQNKEAREEAFNGDIPLPDALENFSRFLRQPGMGEIVMWGNSCSFDNEILKYAYEVYNMPIPWKYTNDRCFRTLKNMFPGFEPPFLGTKHNALSDAYHQAVWASRILGSLEEHYTIGEF
jgi:hypothetical protein